jgi:hypothetical protein
MNCEQAREQLSLFLYGELEFHAEEELEQHLSACADCHAAMEKEKAIHAAADGLQTEVPADLLGQCRRGLRMALETRAAAASTNPFWKLWWHSPAPGGFWTKPLAAAALVAIGFFSARLTMPDSSNDFGSRTNEEVTATRVRFLEPDPSGRVRITLEETRQRQILGDPHEDRIRHWLLRAAQDPGDPGLRVESLDLLKSDSTASEVREALQKALLADSNPGVRIKALEALKPYAEESDVRHTLAQVLLKDDNPGLRTQAIDLLMQHRTRDMVGVLQELMQREDNEYIRLRTQRALREMNASVETF